MGFKKSKGYVKKPIKSDFRRNINKDIGSNTLDNIPFVYALQVNPGQFKLFSLPYTVPSGKKVLITYMSLTSYKVNNQSIYAAGNVVLALSSNDTPVSVSLTQPIEVTEGQQITHPEANGSAAVGGFEIDV